MQVFILGFYSYEQRFQNKHLILGNNALIEKGLNFGV